jgi:hypothetical protein
MKKQDIKKILIDEIKKKGFPTGYLIGEADGYAGYYVENENKVIALDYAEGAKTMKGMSLKALATLLENGVRPKKKGKDEDWEMILEFKGYVEAATNKGDDEEGELL